MYPPCQWLTFNILLTLKQTIFKIFFFKNTKFYLNRPFFYVEILGPFFWGKYEKYIFLWSLSFSADQRVICSHLNLNIGRGHFNFYLKTWLAFHSNYLLWKECEWNVKQKNFKKTNIIVPAGMSAADQSSDI